MPTSAPTTQQDEYHEQQGEAAQQDQEQYADDYSQNTEYYSFDAHDQYDYELYNQTFQTVYDQWDTDKQIDNYERVQQIARQEQGLSEYNEAVVVDRQVDSVYADS